MPTYVYHCDICEKEFEATQRFSDEPLRLCPEGHEAVRRVFTPAGIIFKGSGWYIKDSKSSASTPSSKESKSTSKDESGTSDAATTDDSKSEKKETSDKAPEASPAT